MNNPPEDPANATEQKVLAEAVERVRAYAEWLDASGDEENPCDHLDGSPDKSTDLRTLLSTIDKLGAENERLKGELHQVNTEAGIDLLVLNRRAEAASPSPQPAVRERIAQKAWNLSTGMSPDLENTDAWTQGQITAETYPTGLSATLIRQCREFADAILLDLEGRK